MAVHVANLYLFTYEYDFLTQPAFVMPVVGCADYHRTYTMWRCAHKIIKSFMFTRRYVDDLISFGNRTLESHHTDLLSIHGNYTITIEGRTWPIRGIYPTADALHSGLDITLKTSTLHTPFYNVFMDIGFHLMRLPACENGLRLQASLYDKRVTELHMLPKPTYTHVDSHVAYSTQINTFYAQATRAARITTDHEKWIDACRTFYERMLTAGHNKYDLMCIIDRAMKFGSKTFSIPKTHLIESFLLRVNDIELYHAHHTGRHDQNSENDVHPWPPIPIL
jgi:hypothetical protein